MSKQTLYRVNAKGEVERVSSSSMWRILLMIFVLSSLSGLAAYWWQQRQLDAAPKPTHEQVQIPELDWEDLMLLDYDKGEVPPKLQQWVGKRSKISGFIVPLDAREQLLTEFLLVPVYGMCIHVPPPPPNMMVHVKSETGFETGYWMADGVWLEGELQIQNVESDYGAAGFVMQSAKIYPVEYREAQASELDTGWNTVSERNNLAYGAHPRQILDLWHYPEKPLPTSVVIFIHGGAFNSGDKSSINPKLRNLLLDAGIAVASINYRFSSDAIYPAPMLDAARAVQFLRHQAEAFNLDPARFGAYGIASGAGMALWLGLHDDLRHANHVDAVLQESSRLQAVAGFSAPSSFDLRFHQELFNTDSIYTPLLELFGIPNIAAINRPEYAALYEAASPLSHVSIDDPDIWLFYVNQQPLKPNPDALLYMNHVRFGEYLKYQMQEIGRGDSVKITGSRDYEDEQMLNEELLIFFMQNFSKPGSEPLL